MIQYILQGISLGFSAAIIPGPFQAYLLTQTMKSGWQRALPATLAPIFTDGPIIVLVLVVLTRMPDWFLTMLHIVGGFFLLFLAYGAYRAFKTATHAMQPQSDTASQSLAKAIVINVLNPAPYMFWGTVSGPILIAGWREAPALGISFISSFYGSFVGFLVVLVVLFALARQSGPRVVRILLGVSAVALLLFGLYQIGTGIAGW